MAGVMLSAGVLPALEQLFRQLPVVSPAHVTAAVFLVSCAIELVQVDLLCEGGGGWRRGEGVCVRCLWTSASAPPLHQ